MFLFKALIFIAIFFAITTIFSGNIAIRVIVGLGAFALMDKIFEWFEG